MTLEITLRDDTGNVVASKTGEAAQPTQLKFTKPLLDGSYEIWGFTYQPHVRVRENWVALQKART
jgi:hypothetical protein